MSPEEIDRIEKHVYMYNDDTLIIEDKAFDLDQSVVMLERMVILFKEKNASFLIIDLTNGKRPKPEKNELIKKQILIISDQCKFLSIYTGKNILINIAVQFVLGNVGVPKATSKTKKEALLKIENFK